MGDNDADKDGLGLNPCYLGLCETISGLGL